MQKINKLFLLCAFDPVLFMQTAFDIKADSWQEEILKTNPSKTLLLCSRQSGKSTVSATLALYKATFFNDNLILVLSKSYRQAEETFRKIKKGLSFVSKLRSVVYETQTMLELSNGSRIVALPGRQESIRSFSSVSLLIIDEASQVSDDVYKTVRPMLAVSNGDMIALSTPFGKRGWFYNAWLNGVGWYKVKVTANECSRISSNFIEEEKKEIGEWWVKQEYYCEFMDTNDQLFSHEDILDSIDDTLKSFYVGLDVIEDLRKPT